MNMHSKAQVAISDVELQNFSKEHVLLKEEIVRHDDKVILVDSQEGFNIFELHNDELRRELWMDTEKLNSLVALPGIIELGIYSENLPIRIVVDESVSTELLLKYFKF